MFNKVSSWLSSVHMTVIAGIFMAVSLIMMLSDLSFPVDPVWVTVIICGFPLFYSAASKLILKHKISSALLITIAMMASIAIGELFAAGEVAFIMAVGGLLEESTIKRAKKGLKQLVSLAPSRGRRVTQESGTEVEEIVRAELIKHGDILRVLPGEAVPVDGEVLSGSSSIDQSIITGESLPVDKSEGDSVFCGTINRFGSIDVMATNIGEESSLKKMIRLVQEAESKKAPMQRIVDKWAEWLVPASLAIAAVTYLLTQDVVRAVTVLVVFCPCALALATPTSIMAAIGQATKHGVIIKSGEALEKMDKVNYVAFDKTGTITHGKLSVSDVVCFCPNTAEKELLQMAASVESHSEHPLGKAIVAHASNMNLGTKPIEDFSAKPGRGIQAVVDGEKVLCGNVEFLTESGVSIDESVVSRLESLRSQGKAVIIVSVGRTCLGAVALSDTLRADSAEAINDLQLMGLGTVLLTGDHPQTAGYFADQVGIKKVHAGLLPEQKVEIIERLLEEGSGVCMIGDGVNDAPVLKTASVGIAMGGVGSDIAVEAADIVLPGDDISKISYIKSLSNATIKMIKFNIVMAMTINFLAIVLSVTGLLNPITGALVHNVGSVLVVLNAASLYDRKQTDGRFAKAQVE